MNLTLSDGIIPIVLGLFRDGIDGPSFYAGCFTGVLVAGILARIASRILIAWARRKLPDRPMTVQTQGTPRQIMEVAAGAALAALGWTVVLILAGMASAFAVYLIVNAFGQP